MTRTEGGSSSRLNRRLAWAVPALIILGATIAIAGVTTVIEVRSLQDDGYQIAFTGRERAAAERASGLVNELVETEDAAAQHKVARRLAAAMSDWRGLHEELVASNHGGLTSVLTEEALLSNVSRTLDSLLVSLEHEAAALIGAVRDADGPVPTARLRELAGPFHFHHVYFMYTLDAIDLKLAEQVQTGLGRIQIVEGALILACALLLAAVAWWLLRPALRELRAQLRELRRTAGELRENRNLLAQMYVSAERQRAQRDEMLTAVSHDLKSPLSAISLAAAVARRSPERAAAMADQVGELCKRGAAMIDAVIAEARESAGLTDAAPEPTDLRVLLEQTAHAHLPEAIDKGLELHVRMLGELPARVVTDPDKLSRIVDNLIRNAVSYTNSGRIDVTVSPEAHGRDGVRIDVIDTGPGMNPIQLSRLTRPYQRGKAGDGHGLGLAIARRLAIQLGGELSAASEPGHGSRFSLWIPLDLPQGDRFAADLSRALSDSGVLHDARILIADDEPELVALTAALLREVGARVLVARDGDELVRLGTEQHRCGEPVHVALIDISMPQRDGYAACRALREAGVTARLIAVTGHTFQHDRERCLDSGFDDYLAKPASAAELLERIVRWLPGGDGSPRVAASAG